MRTIESLLLARVLSGEIVPLARLTRHTPYVAVPLSLTIKSPEGGSKVDSRSLVERVGKHRTK